LEQFGLFLSAGGDGNFTLSEKCEEAFLISEQKAVAGKQKNKPACGREANVIFCEEDAANAFEVNCRIFFPLGKDRQVGKAYNTLLSCGAFKPRCDSLYGRKIT